MCSEDRCRNHANIQRIQNLKAKGIYPYAQNFVRTHSILKINETYEGIDHWGENVLLHLCGRVTKIDTTKNLLRVYLEDRDAKLQFVLEATHVPLERIELFKDSVSRGDYIGFEVTHVYRSNRDSLTARVSDWYFLAPCLRVLPKPTEDRASQDRHCHSQRLNDFWARQRVISNAKMLRFIRRFLDEADCFEVKTPTLQPVLSRAGTDDQARSSLDQGVNTRLRTSQHAYLKQLIIEGMERVYEIADVFSDEAIDWLHYPEQQLLECCISPADANDLMTLTERLISRLAVYLHSTDVILWKSLEDMQAAAAAKNDAVDTAADPLTIEEEFVEIPIDLTLPWSRRSFYQLVEEVTQVDFLELQTVDEAVAIALQAGADIAETAQFSSVGQVALEVMNQLIAPGLIQPTFVVGYPMEISPMAKPYPNYPRLADRARLFINGLEFASVQSEQTEVSLPSGDGFDDHAAAVMDSDCAQSLEYGMLPTSVLQINLNYLAMLMTDVTDIRDTILFPIYG